MNKLKRCPFCGGEAEFHRSLSVIGDIVTVRCKACQTKTAGILFDARKHQNDEEYDEVAALWNNRKPVDDVLERLKKEENDLFSARKALSLKMYSDFESLEKSKMLLEKELTLFKVIEIIKEELGGMTDV